VGMYALVRTGAADSRLSTLGARRPSSTSISSRETSGASAVGHHGCQLGNRADAIDAAGKWTDDTRTRCTPYLGLAPPPRRGLPSPAARRSLLLPADGVPPRSLQVTAGLEPQAVPGLARPPRLCRRQQIGKGRGQQQTGRGVGCAWTNARLVQTPAAGSAARGIFIKGIDGQKGLSVDASSWRLTSRSCPGLGL